LIYKWTLHVDDPVKHLGLTDPYFGLVHRLGQAGVAAQRGEKVYSLINPADKNWVSNWPQIKLYVSHIKKFDLECCIQSKHRWYIQVNDLTGTIFHSTNDLTGTIFHSTIDMFEAHGFTIDMLITSKQWDCYVGNDSEYAMIMFMLKNDCTYLTINKSVIQ